MDDAEYDSSLERHRFGEPGGERRQIEAARVAAVFRTETGHFVFENLEILGDLDLQEAQVTAAARFVDCLFSKIRAERATFNGSLSFVRCNVKHFQGYHAHFDDFRIIGGDVKRISCANAIVAKTFSIKDGIVGRIELNSCRVAGNLRIRNVYAQVISAQRAAVSGILDLRQLSAKRFDIDGLHADRIDAIGLALSKSASFDRIEIKDQVDLTNARIGCLLAMRAAAIGDDLYFGNADIRGLDLSGTTVVDALFLDGTFIRGDLTALGGAFSNCECSAKILGSVRITDATFNVARFVDIRVQKGVYFNRNAVSGTLTIESRGTVMATVGERCTFGGTRIGGQILIRDIEIKGQLSMVSLTATDIIFRNVRIGKEMNLTGASATLGMTLRSCVVGLSVDLQSISTTSLNVSESSCESISAEGANIKGSATFESVDLLDLSAVHAQINATLKLSGARIARSLDLSRAEVGNLEFGSDLEDPPETYSFPKRVVLRNCKYGSLQGQWRTLLARLEGATAYDSTAYLALEDFMRSRGRSDWADSVYLSSKTHAAKMLQSGAKRFAQSVLEWISGYGARPFRLLRAFAIIVATVAFILFVTPQLYPRLLIHSREPFGVLLMRACFTTLDVLVKGDRSAIFTQASGARSSMALQAILDVVAILRYTALAVFTLWLAYITGLVRYVGTRG